MHSIFSQKNSSLTSRIGVESNKYERKDHAQKQYIYFPQLQLPAAHSQVPPQVQLEFPQPDMFALSVGIEKRGLVVVDISGFFVCEKEMAGLKQQRRAIPPFYLTRPPLAFGDLSLLCTYPPRCGYRRSRHPCCLVVPAHLSETVQSPCGSGPVMAPGARAGDAESPVCASFVGRIRCWEGHLE